MSYAGGVVVGLFRLHPANQGEEEEEEEDVESIGIAFFFRPAAKVAPSVRTDRPVGA